MKFSIGLLVILNFIILQEEHFVKNETVDNLLWMFFTIVAIQILYKLYKE